MQYCCDQGKIRPESNRPFHLQALLLKISSFKLQASRISASVDVKVPLDASPTTSTKKFIPNPVGTVQTLPSIVGDR